MLILEIKDCAIFLKVTTKDAQKFGVVVMSWFNLASMSVIPASAAPLMSLKFLIQLSARLICSSPLLLLPPPLLLLLLLALLDEAEEGSEEII